MLEATLSLVQKPDVAGSQHLLLGRINKTAAAQMAMNETSAPLTFWVIGLCPTSGIAVDVIKGEAAPNSYRKGASCWLLVPALSCSVTFPCLHLHV